MQDELFHRGWNEGHARFSADLGGLLKKLFAGGKEPVQGIDKPYAPEAHIEREPLREATSSLVSGLAAVATTLMLFVTVGALAIPGAAGAAPAQLELAAMLNEGLLL